MMTDSVLKTSLNCIYEYIGISSYIELALANISSTVL